MLAGIYVGAMYADAIPAILINTPGTPAAIATTFDGFPLAQKGKAQQALVTAAFASFVGSVIANIVLATLAEPLAELSLKFGPPEYFCDHFPDNWGYPYVSYNDQGWFSFQW